MLTAVHMEPDDHPDADWRSIFASLTFAVP